MKKIKPNSIAAVIYFSVYIAQQDGKFSDMEKSQLFADLPIIKKLYLDFYGELIYEDLKSLCEDFFQNHKIKESFQQSKINKDERIFINSILTDPALRDVALLVARNASSADGFDIQEQNKYKYWFKCWIK